MIKKSLLRPWRSLRGKLTLSYTWTTVVTLLLIEIVGIGTALWISSLNAPFFVLSALKQEAPQASPYFVHSPPDQAALTEWLQNPNAAPSKQGPFSLSTPVFLAVVDIHARVLTSVGTNPLAPDTSLPPLLSPQGSVNLQAVLGDRKGTTSKIAAEQNTMLLAIAPIVRTRVGTVGALVMKIAQPDSLHLFVEFLQFIVLSVIVLTALATIAGSVSGYLTARSFTRRLKGLAVATERWSQGDFSAHIADPSEDELGQTMRQLNHMAEQVQQLLQAHQKLATLEERNRLARDLHDSVKQQIFAASMQIGVTKVLLKRDVAAAEARLNEVEMLVKQAQQELTSLIRELRPVALDGKSLVTALRALTTQWTQQTDIVATLHTEVTQPVALAVEEALFRVVQEALSNIARHSKATLVHITLTTAADTVTLSITDNGQGFDRARQGYSGVGLLSMQERMKALAGETQIESAPGKGTRIVVSCKRSGVNTKTASLIADI